ncbi:MBOAT family protein [Eubacteriales bacterium OttesenSCG-928-A19]|nr:MBOAT family protein [Eubacteriales bacterium OttesenSCG-928-A19]
MGFATPAFVSLFLPVTLGLCVLARGRLRAQNVILLAASLLFYAWGEPVYILLLLALALGNGLLARRIAVSHARKASVLTALAVAINLGILFAFKYIGFFADTFHQLTGILLPLPRPRLPLGISFFTFQALSYVLDVRRGVTKPADSLWMLLLYLCFFPQLIAGPILQWNQVKDQLYARGITGEGVSRGLRRFIVGLSKKLLLADVLGGIADAAFACPAHALGAPLAWYGAIAYTLQIYLDFSGYSDMAIGMGHMFGFHFPENFRYPLRAGGMQAFWRRWHITLTDWFRSYLYIPLGGNRRGKPRTYRNMAIVFLFTGLWHGASWTFVLWGAWNGLFCILEYAGIIRVRRWPAWLAHLYTLAVVALGFVLFRSPGVGAAGVYLRAMCLNWQATPLRMSYFLEQCSPMRLTLLLASGAVSVDAFRRAGRLLAARPWGRAGMYAASLLLLLCAYTAMVASEYHPFIYFRF